MHNQKVTHSLTRLFLRCSVGHNGFKDGRTDAVGRKEGWKEGRREMAKEKQQGACTSRSTGTTHTHTQAEEERPVRSAFGN